MNGAYGVRFEELGNKQDVGIMIDSMFDYAINGRVGINADFVSFLFIVFHVSYDIKLWEYKIYQFYK